MLGSGQVSVAQQQFGTVHVAVGSKDDIAGLSNLSPLYLQKRKSRLYKYMP
jgi:hypothetical protein